MLLTGFLMPIGSSYESMPRRFIPQPVSGTISQAIERMLEMPVAAVPPVLM